MTNIVLPKLNQTGANEWADVQDNDEAIKKVVNGELDNENLKAGAGITDTKFAKPVIMGSVNAEGKTVLGTGFVSARIAAGSYTITLSVELTSPATMIANAVHGSPSPLILVTASSKKVFEVETRASAEALVDGAFSFCIKQA